MSAKTVELLTKLRDSLQMAADACNDYLETMTPTSTRSFGDFNMLRWIEKKGTKAPYEQTTKQMNQNSQQFQALQQKLQKGGFWQSASYKFWLHGGKQDIIDRRRKG